MLAAARYGTRDMDRATSFYDQIAEIVGAKRIIDQPTLVAYRGAEGGVFLIGKPFEGEATVGNGAQVSLAVSSRALVDAVHAKALELGGKCEGKPGIRGSEEMGFYGAYFRDLDGNKLSVGCFGQA